MGQIRRAPSILLPIREFVDSALALSESDPGALRFEVRDLVRESIRHYVSIQKFRALRKSTLPFAEAARLLTDKDVFLHIS